MIFTLMIFTAVLLVPCILGSYLTDIADMKKWKDKNNV